LEFTRTSSGVEDPSQLSGDVVGGKMPRSPLIPKRVLIVRVDSTLAGALDRNKSDTGVPFAEFIRRAIRMALFADAQNEPVCREVRSFDR
jgi:hypothetical protein